MDRLKLTLALLLLLIPHFGSTVELGLLPSNHSADLQQNSESEIFMLIVQNEYTDEAGKEGWQVIANKMTKVLFIGNQHLSGNERVAFSKYGAPFGEEGNRDGKSWFNHDLINPFVID